MTGTERKVFQKYFPPDFDPSKIPKASGPRNRQFVQRVMAPFNMQCNTCHEYIYKGKKFNMRRETAEGESYLGMMRIFRFYFRCPNCLAEITFKTDIENVDYKMEHGATRLFDAFKFYQEKEKEKEHEEEEEKADAMKMLEKRTKMSRIEMEALGHIEELQELNRRNEKVNALDYLEAQRKQELSQAEQLRLQEEEDERELRRLLGKNDQGKFERRLQDDNDYGDDGVGDGQAPSTSTAAHPKPTSKAVVASLRAGLSTLPPPIAFASSSSSTATAKTSAPANPAAVLKRSAAQMPKFMQGVIVKKKKPPGPPE